MQTHSVVWINTGGTFKVSGFEHEESAAEYAEMLNESGIPTMFISRDTVLTNDDEDYEPNTDHTED